MDTSTSNSVWSEYKKIGVDSSFYGKVYNVEDYKSLTLFESKGLKYYIDWCSNYEYTPPDFNKFVRDGSLIKKNKGTDTIIVIKNNVEYFFILGKTINK